MNTFKKLFLILLFFSINIANLKSQGTAGDKARYETRFIVDMPTAGMLPNNNYAIYTSVYPYGGLMLSVDFGIFQFVNAGMSFSGNNIVGDGEIEFQKFPGISIKARILDEKKSSPAVVGGFSNQGASNYIGDGRFKTHSPGFYLAASKNFIWDLGNLAVHGGANFSFDPNPEDRSPNLYFGAEQSLGNFFALNVELNLMIDEKEHQYYNKKGLLNASIRASIVSGVTAELKFRDLFNHGHYSNGHERIIGLEIIKYLN